MVTEKLKTVNVKKNKRDARLSRRGKEGDRKGRRKTVTQTPSTGDSEKWL